MPQKTPEGSVVMNTTMKLAVMATAIGCLVRAPQTGWAQCCGDCNGDGQVTINELIGAVNNDLNSCPEAQQHPSHGSALHKFWYERGDNLQCRQHGSVPLNVAVESPCDNGGAAAPNSCSGLGPGQSCNLTTYAGTGGLPLNCWCEFTVTGGSAASVRAGMQVYPDLPGTSGTFHPKRLLPLSSPRTSTARQRPRATS